MIEFKKKIKSLEGISWNNINLLCSNSNKNVDTYKIEFLNFYFTSEYNKIGEMIYIHFIVPKDKLPKIDEKYHVFLEDYILRNLGDKINVFNRNMYGNVAKKESHGEIVYQKCDNFILSRSSIKYDLVCGKLKFFLKIRFPLKNNKIISKNIIHYVTKLTYVIRETIKLIDFDDFNNRYQTYINQKIIRQFLDENDYICFIANGSILPRFNGTDSVDLHANEFISPPSLEIAIPLPNNKIIRGLGIKKGITSIIGGAFSGKTTLLNAIEKGIYNHILGDGREYCISTESTIKILADDGRYINNMNISLFFKENLIFDNKNFNTLHASGSVSQATNLIEAINCGAKVILIDEDSSATNFLFKDSAMRNIIKTDNITPLIDRIDELSNIGVSFVLVTGSTSQFIELSDRILKFDNFTCLEYLNKKNIDTIESKINNIFIDNKVKCSRIININNISNINLLFFKKISIITNNIIFIDEFEINIRSLTSIQNISQINTLCFSAIHILGNARYMKKELKDNTFIIKEMFFNDAWTEVALSSFYKYQYFFEEVRPIDIYFFINRMRGLQFEKNETK